jgi:predicted  nucleic acid-binding Zn-ribbon protein
MFGENFSDLVLKYGLSGAFSVYVISLLVPRLFKARTEVAATKLEAADLNARTDIIEAMQVRMNSLETEQYKLRMELDAERDKRVEAEDLVDRLLRENDRLKTRVAALEQHLRELGHEPV